MAERTTDTAGIGQGTYREQTGMGTGGESTVDQTKEKAGELAGQAKETTGQLVSQVTEQAKPKLESQKEQAAQSLSSAAQALRQSSGQLREQQQSAVAQAAESAADQVERAAGFLRGRDVNELVREAEDFARRKPYVFMGAAGAIGLMAGRFLKSSGSKATPSSSAQSRPEVVSSGQLARPAFVEDVAPLTPPPPPLPQDEIWTPPESTAPVVPPEREMP